MQRRVRRGYVAGILMMATIGLFLFAMVSPVVSSTTDFSIYNSGWNGTSSLAVATYELGRFAPSFAVKTTETDMTIVHLNLEQIELVPQTDVLMVLGPTKPYSSVDGQIVGDFVRAGGVLVLADDFGAGNSLLEAMGASSRFSGKLLMDLSFDKRPEFSVCFNFEDDPLTAGVTKMLLNHPSSITVSGVNTTVVAESSIASWLDSDGDSVRDLGEPKGPFPVVARERMGTGKIILLSDPSVLINGMITQLDNSIFADNLIVTASDARDSVFFDESHREYFDPIAVTTQITGDLSLIDKANILCVAFVLLIWVSTDVIDRAVIRTMRASRKLVRKVLSLFGRRLPDIDEREQLSAEEMIEEIAARHPDWKLGLLRHTIAESRRHGDHVRGVSQRKALAETPSEQAE
jgi:hypothetical protein